MILDYIISLLTVGCFLTASALHLDETYRNVDIADNVVSLISNISSQTVCIWSNDTNEITDNLVKPFTTCNKTVMIMELINSFLKECLHNVVVLNTQTNCTWLLSNEFHYTEMYNFYMILIGKWEFTDLSLTLCLEQFGSARAVFLSLSDLRMFSLSSPFLPPRRLIQNDRISPPEILGPKSLEGREIKVATFNCSPFVIFDRGNDTEYITGIEWKLLQEMSNLLNFKVKLIELKGKGEWGAVINGSWNGGIGLALAEGAADIGVCNIWNSLRFYSIMDFGPPNNVVTFTFIVPRPQLVSHQWHSLVNIFTSEVWGYTLMLYILCVYCYWQFCNVHRRNPTTIGLVESVLTMFGILMLTSWTARTLSKSSQQLIVHWLVFVMILTAVFSSSIVARLTLPGFETRIDTVQQLVEGDFHWFDKNYTAHDKQSIYFNLVNYWQRQWEKRYQLIHTRDIVSAINSRKVAFPIQRWGGKLVFFSQVGLDYNLHLTDMRVLKETTSFSYVSFGFAKKSSMYRRFKRSLQLLYEHGITSYWASKMIQERGEKYSKQLLQERDVVEAKLQKLSMTNLKPAFYILFSGLFVSLLLFFSEKLSTQMCKDKPDRGNEIPFLH